MKFNRIVAIDNTGLISNAIDELGECSDQEVVFCQDDPTTDEEIIARIGDAECMLVSWRTRVDSSVIKRCPGLRFVGLCCSLYDEASSNVDVAFARQQGIEVAGVRDYGDEGLVEYVISELIQLCKGLGEHQWRSEPVELTGKTLGIVGLGTTGRMLADRAHAFGMNVIYFSRTRKPEAEQLGFKYRPLHRLLEEAEIVSLHLPRNTNVLGPEEFSVLGDGKILVNTSLGLVFDKLAFVEWAKAPGNFAIFDGDGAGSVVSEFSKLAGVITTEKVSGWTAEARQRLSDKVLANVVAFLNGRD